MSKCHVRVTELELINMLKGDTLAINPSSLHDDELWLVKIVTVLLLRKAEISQWKSLFIELQNKNLCGELNRLFYFNDLKALLSSYTTQELPIYRNIDIKRELNVIDLIAQSEVQDTQSIFIAMLTVFKGSIVKDCLSSAVRASNMALLKTVMEANPFEFELFKNELLSIALDAENWTASKYIRLAGGFRIRSLFDMFRNDATKNDAYLILSSMSCEEIGSHIDSVDDFQIAMNIKQVEFCELISCIDAELRTDLISKL